MHFVHPPLRILSLTSKIPGSASLCRLRFPPDCGTGNQPAENRRRSIKPCRPHPAFYAAPRKRLVLIVTGNPVRFRRHRNWTLRLYATANDAPVYPARSSHKAKGYWIFAGNPACTDAKVLPVKRQYTATTNIT